MPIFITIFDVQIIMDKYKVVKEIGRGGFGRALLVKSTVTNELKVVKEMKLDCIPENQREQAFNEIEILSSLKHTNIIRYRGCSKQKNKLFILMDYADKGDLMSMMKNQNGVFVSEDRILDWFVQICLAIKYVHDRKILHRDLKPQNIFMSEGDIIKLGDFGISKALDNTSEMANTAIGTPHYTSPEICIGKRYNAKSDIWSLGVILYELMTFKKPFNGLCIAEIMQNILYKNYKPISSMYSKEICELVHLLLNKNPDNRPGINEILQMPLIKNKAIALLGKTLAKSELNHGVFHGLKAGSTPEVFKDEINLAIEPSPKIPDSKTNMKVVKELKKMAKELEDLVKAKHVIVPNEMESLNEGDFYFMGRKLVLKSVKENDPIGFKIESVRVFLEEMLGMTKMKQIYDSIKDQNQHLPSFLSNQSDIYVFQLIMQLIAYEAL